MCLRTITEKYEKPVRRVVKAYKSFDHFGRKLPVEFRHRQYNGAYAVVFDKWLQAVEQELFTEFDATACYISGFHCYTGKKLPSSYDRPVWPVYQYEITTRGEQDGYEVTVSRYLYIPSDPAAPAPKSPATMLRARAKKGA